MAAQTYKVLSDTSTRVNPDPDSPDYDNWLFYPAGSTVKFWPDHAPVEEWVASGHWQPIAESKVKPPAEETA